MTEPKHKQQVELSLILPVYNEEECIQETLKEARRVLVAELETCDVCCGYRATGSENPGLLPSLDTPPSASIRVIYGPSSSFVSARRARAVQLGDGVHCAAQVLIKP